MESSLFFGILLLVGLGVAVAIAVGLVVVLVLIFRKPSDPRQPGDPGRERS